MRFYREKSWLLGLLALISPLPLPFNEIVGWPPVLAFCGATALFLFRTSRGAEGVLPYWAMNLLGLLYIPFLVGDLSLLRVGRVLPPLTHLALYVIAVKLFALRHEKDKWHLFLGLFFLFIASMGTSVHPAAIFYLLAFGSLAALILMRFAGLHTVATLLRSIREPRVPVGRFLTGIILLSVVAAIPLFFFMPRLRQPYVYLPSGVSGGTVQASGFSDRLDLGMIDRVRSTRTVAFRFAYETPPPPATEMRFKAATYDTYDDGGWRREPRGSARLPRGRDGFIHVVDHFPISWMKIWLRQGNNRLVLPVETSVVDLPGNEISMDGAGEARFLFPNRGIAEYRAGMTAESVVGGWHHDRSRPSELENSSSPRMAALAATVMGSGDLEERIRRLERYLRSEYRYSLDPVNTGSQPIERFLFDTKQGHCEYFASAMVLLLRSQGVPARMATGYLGSDYNPLEEYFIVRQSNAHAWVEAFLPRSDLQAAGEGAEDSGSWVIFDPTPADARPQSTTGLGMLMAQAYDYVLFRWDRYVLTYGFGDQVDVFIGLRNAWQRFWEALGSPKSKQSPDQIMAPDAEPEEPAVDDERAATPFTGWHIAPFLALLAALAIWFIVRRERFSATVAYRSLRAKAASREADDVPTWVGPLRLEERLVKRYPNAAAETRCIVSHYVRESFAGEELSESDLAEVKHALGEAKKKLKKTA